ncbi:MAG: ABC transporter substrate-binding protein [Bdellovibrionota bacterium]
MPRNFPTAGLRFISRLLAVLPLWFGIACQRPSVPADTAVVVVESRPRNLEPYLAGDAVGQKIGNLIHAGLFEIGKDMKPSPGLAESVAIENQRRFHFKLRPGLFFHDGTPLRASDVVRSIEEFRQKSPHAVVFDPVQRVYHRGDHDLFIETRAAQPFLLYDLPAVKVFKRVNGAVVGAGQFRLVELTASGALLERVESKMSEDQGGNLKKIKFLFVQDELTRYQLLVRGDANVAINSLGLIKTHHLQAHLKGELQLRKSEGVSFGYLCFNFKNPKLADLKVRQAIAHSIDVQTILTHRMHGYAKPATGILSSAHREYYQPAVEAYPYDPALAERLLDEAGFPRPSPGAKRFALNFKTTSERAGYDMAKVLSEYLRQVGIDVRLQVVETGTFFSEIKAGNFDLFQARWVGVTNPSIYARVFHSSQSRGGLNRGAYSNKAMDDLLDKAMSEPDDRKRRNLFSEVQKLAAIELPYVSLWHWNTVFIGHKKFENVKLYPTGSFHTLAEIEVQDRL